MTYEATDPTVDSQIIQLKDSGANVFFNVSAPKAAAQGIRKAAEIDWKPVHYLNNVSASVAAVMKPAGFDNAQGIITAAYIMDATDKQWDDNAEMKAWRAWMDKNMPTANKADANHIYGYAVAALMTETLKRCGDELTRANLMKQAASFQKFRVPLLLPGITVSTSPTDFYPIQAVQLAALQGRDLGAVRRRHARREQLIRRLASTRKKAAGFRRPFLWTHFRAATLKTCISPRGFFSFHARVISGDSRSA